MSAGRWLDDAYGNGAPEVGHAGPRLTRWMKWTWPAAFALALILTALIGPAGWAVAAAAWIASAIPFQQADRRAERRADRRDNYPTRTAKRRGHPVKR